MLCFHRYLSVNTGRAPVPGFFPDHWSQILSEGRWGGGVGTSVLAGRGYPSTGYPQARRGLGYPLARSGWGTPQPGQDEVPPVRIRMEYPCGQVRMTPLPSKVRIGYPQPGQDGVPTPLPLPPLPPRDRRAEQANTCYAATGLLRSSRRTFLLYLG